MSRGFAGREFISATAIILLVTGAAWAEPPARSPDVIVKEMSVAQQELKGAIGDSHGMADPAKRPEIAARALPPLRRLVADERELAMHAGRPVPTFFEVQLRAIGMALGDADSTDALTALTANASLSLRGQGGALLARWLQCPGDAGAQSKVVDDLATLDDAHPDSDDLAHFTGLMSGSAATAAVRARLLHLLGPMTSHRAALLRQQMPTTKP